MSLKPLFALLAICIVFFACNKSKDEVPVKVETPPIPKIKTMAMYAGNQLEEELSYEYDSLGRLKIESSSKDYFYTYEYASGIIISKFHWPKMNSNSTDTLILNEKGLVVSFSKISDKIEYTPEGYKAKWTYFEGDQGHSYTYKTEDGNTTRRTERFGKDLSTVFIRDIYTFLPNSVNTIGDQNKGITYYGKQDKNLISNHEAIIETPYKSYKIYFTYEFDDQNRVVKLSRSNGGSDYYTTFTYYD